MCELHRDRVAVAIFDGGKWCPECAATFEACPQHPEHPSGYDDQGLPLCQMCTLDDAGALEAVSLSRRVA